MQRGGGNMEFKKLKKIGTENDKNRLNQLCNEKNLTKEDLILNLYKA